jgi:hypothetical protein
MRDAIDGLARLFKGEGGWGNIPKGTKGGQRKRVGNKYQYRYPDGKGGWQSRPGKGGKRKAKAKGKSKTPAPGDTTRLEIQQTEKRIYELEEEFRAATTDRGRHSAAMTLKMTIKNAEERFGEKHPVVPPSVRNMLAHYDQESAKTSEGEKTGKNDPIEMDIVKHVMEDDALTTMNNLLRLGRGASDDVDRRVAYAIYDEYRTQKKKGAASFKKFHETTRDWGTYALDEIVAKHGARAEKNPKALLAEALSANYKGDAKYRHEREAVLEALSTFSDELLDDKLAEVTAVKDDLATKVSSGSHYLRPAMIRQERIVHMVEQAKGMRGGASDKHNQKPKALHVDERKTWEAGLRRNVKNKVAGGDGGRVKAGAKVSLDGKNWKVYDFDADADAPEGSTLVLFDGQNMMSGVRLDNPNLRYGRHEKGDKKDDLSGVFSEDKFAEEMGRKEPSGKGAGEYTIRGHKVRIKKDTDGRYKAEGWVEGSGWGSLMFVNSATATEALKQARTSVDEKIGRDRTKAAERKARAETRKQRYARDAANRKRANAADLKDASERKRKTGGGMQGKDPLEAWRKKKAEMDKKSMGLDSIDGLEALSKAGTHKYKSRKKVKGKWVYDYGDKGKASADGGKLKSGKTVAEAAKKMSDAQLQAMVNTLRSGIKASEKGELPASVAGSYAPRLAALEAEQKSRKQDKGTPGVDSAWGGRNLGKPDTIHMNYGGTRYKYDHGIFVDATDDDGLFHVSQAGNPTKKLGTASSLDEAKKLALRGADFDKSGDAVEGLEELSKARYYDMDYGSGKMTAKYAGARWPEKESAFMGKSKGDVIQELIAKMEAGDISQKLIGKMKAIGIQGDVIQQLIGKCNTRKARKSHFEPTLKKGLYAFDLGSENKGRKLSDNLLPQYLAAFVEQAYEHEKQECEHMKNKPAGYDDQLTFYAQRIMNELVIYMRNNPDLLAAGQDATGNSIANILRNSGLIQPDVSGFDNNEGNGWTGEAALVRSGESPWLQEDPAARPTPQMTDHHKQASFIDDAEDPTIALRKANAAKRQRAFTAPEPEFVVKGDGDCPVHGYGDLTKMQNLVTPMGKCTCN